MAVRILFSWRREREEEEEEKGGTVVGTGIGFEGKSLSMSSASCNEDRQFMSHGCTYTHSRDIIQELSIKFC